MKLLFGNASQGAVDPAKLYRTPKNANIRLETTESSFSNGGIVLLANLLVYLSTEEAPPSYLGF